MVGCCVFFLLCHLSLRLHGLSSHCAVTSCSASLGPLIRLVVASPPSHPADCCITSPHAATSHLRVPSPLITPLPLVMPLSVPLSLAPLVRLVVALPLLTLLPLICRHLCLSFRHRLLLRHGLPCLLSGWLLHSLSSRCCFSSASNSSSHCAIAYCHAPLHAIASCASSLAGYSVASPHVTASICWCLRLSLRHLFSLRHGLPCHLVFVFTVQSPRCHCHHHLCLL
jgi:hypothetical protein